MPLSGVILKKGNSNSVKNLSLFQTAWTREKHFRPNSCEKVIFAAPGSQHKDQCHLTNTKSLSQPSVVHKARSELHLGFDLFREFLLKPNGPCSLCTSKPKSGVMPLCWTVLYWCNTNTRFRSGLESLNCRIPMIKWMRYTNMASAKKVVGKYVSDSFLT